MSAPSPYKALNDPIKTESAMMSLTYEQMLAAANALWNLYLLLDAVKACGLDSAMSPILVQVRDDCARDEMMVNSVHQAFVNCLMAHDAAYKAANK